jgi:hypothetical protein
MRLKRDLSKARRKAFIARHRTRRMRMSQATSATLSNSGKKVLFNPDLLMMISSYLTPGCPGQAPVIVGILLAVCSEMTNGIKHSFPRVNPCRHACQVFKTYSFDTLRSRGSMVHRLGPNELIFGRPDFVWINGVILNVEVRPHCLTYGDFDSVVRCRGVSISVNVDSSHFIWSGYADVDNGLVVVSYLVNVLFYLTEERYRTRRILFRVPGCCA